MKSTSRKNYNCPIFYCQSAFGNRERVFYERVIIILLCMESIIISVSLPGFLI